MQLSASQAWHRTSQGIPEIVECVRMRKITPVLDRLEYYNLLKSETQS